MEKLSGKKILITGGSGLVGRAVAESLVVRNEVWCIGRFPDSTVEVWLRDRGVRTYHWDMAQEGLEAIPDDFTHVLHAAVDRGTKNDFETAVTVNSVGAGRLMVHCRRAEAFLYLSTGAVYEPQEPSHLHTEADPLSAHSAWLPTYPVSKLATEGTVRAFAATLELPTTIARLNVAYGPYGHGGIPIIFFRQMLNGDPIAVPHRGQHYCSPIHTRDLARQTPGMWAAGRSRATVVNWGGEDLVGIQDLLSYVSGLTDVPVKFARREVTRSTVAFDPASRRALVGKCDVGWYEGVREALEAHFPRAVRDKTKT